MAMSPKYLLGVMMIALLLISCKADKIQLEPWERGGDWLSWTQSERNRYVIGFLDGYLMARHTACIAADSLFEVGQPHRMGDEQNPTEYPTRFQLFFNSMPPFVVATFNSLPPPPTVPESVFGPNVP
jgi:hypothetical protein